MRPVFRRVLDFWQQRHPHERRLAKWCAAVLAVATMLVAEEWQRNERTRLQFSIPAAEAKLTALQKLADEWGVHSAVREPKTLVTSLDPIVLSLKTQGFLLDITPIGDGKILLKGSANFDEWVNWLAELPLRGWSLEQATISQRAYSKDGAPNNVGIEATIRAARS